MNRPNPSRTVLLFRAALLALLIPLCPVAALADRETVDGILWVYEVENGKASLGACAVPHATEGTVTVPSQLGGCPVTRVGDYAFYACDQIVRVILPDGVEMIDEHAFQDCTALEAVEIPDTVDHIGYYAFYNCPSLMAVKLPEKISAIGNYAFSGCGALASVEWPDGLVSIGISSFSHCTSLTAAKLPPRVEKIGDYAFCTCTALREVVLPKGLKTIGADAFFDCSALEELEIPKSVTELGKESLSGTALKKIVLLGRPNRPYAIWDVPEECVWVDGKGKTVPPDPEKEEEDTP